MKINRFKTDKIIKIVVGLIFLVIISGIIRQYYTQSQVSKYRQKTIGKIIKFEYLNRTEYYLTYEYYVKNIRYEEGVGVAYFECENGKKGCIGSTFTVYYSSKEPKYSRIDLGEYEKYKQTVEFVK